MVTRWERIFAGLVIVYLVVFVYLVFPYNGYNTSVELEGNEIHSHMITSQDIRTGKRTDSGVEATASDHNDSYDPFSVSANVSGDCQGMAFPGHLGARDTWSAVDDTKDAYVFSAYHDEMSPSHVVLIGAMAGGKNNYICQLWFMSKVNKTVSMTEDVAISKPYTEGHGRKYTASKFICKFPGKETPIGVSITSKQCAQPRRLLPVKEIKQKSYIRNFTVCITPLNYRYGRAFELVEWIELSRILGADKFVFYNYSSASNVAQVLDAYSKRGLAEIVQWQLPVGVDTWPKTDKPVEIHYFGQLAALNECLLRNKEQSRYLVNLDLDEFLIPYSDTSTTWADMLTELPNNSAYIFLNTFFRKEWNSDHDFEGKDLAEKYKLVTLLKIKRENKIFPSRLRSKYIAKTTEVESLNIHDLIGQSVYTVPQNKALLHHYRNWDNYNDSQPRVKDDIIVRKYKDVLIENVVKAWSTLDNVEMDIPI